MKLNQNLSYTHIHSSTNHLYIKTDTHIWLELACILQKTIINQKMGEEWPMRKKLGMSEIYGTLLFKKTDEGVNLRKHLFEWWPQKRVKQARKDVENGAEITLYNVDTNETMETNIVWVIFDGYHIKWDVTTKNYVVGDEILMRWESTNNRLCYKVVQDSTLRYGLQNVFPSTTSINNINNPHRRW